MILSAEPLTGALFAAAGWLAIAALALVPAGRAFFARHLAFLLAFSGFGAKAGMNPLHVWLSETHPAAPSPVSALMSGVMIKTALAGQQRPRIDGFSARSN